jgi:hypothetical protein
MSVMNAHIRNTTPALKTAMPSSHQINRGAARPFPSLIVNDLCAHMAPLNRYGVPSLGAALANGLRSLMGASRTAVCSAAGCDDA